MQQSDGSTKQSQPCYVMVQPAGADDDVISLGEIWQTLVQYKWRLFFITCFFSVAASVYALLATPLYSADVLLAPVQKGEQAGRLGGLASQLGGLADLAGISISGAGVDTTLASMESRQFISEFIKDENLKPILFSDNWDHEKKQWIVRSPSIIALIKGLFLPDKEASKSPEQLEPGEPTMWSAYLRFSSILTIKNDPKTGLVQLKVEWKDPKQAAKWANALVDRLNLKLRQQAINESQLAIQYLKKQIEQTSLADLRVVLFRVIEEQTKNITFANVKEEFALKVIDPAVPPESISYPKRLLIIALGIVMGLFVGIVTAIFGGIFMKNQGKSD